MFQRAVVYMPQAAGLVPYRHPDPQYADHPEHSGKPANQILIDSYVNEAVHSVGRYYNPAGEPIHLDVENFSGSDDLWGADVPRLDPPMRLGLRVGQRDPIGGFSGAIFPMGEPTGQHGFDFPGEQTDKGIAQCEAACQAACVEGEECDCSRCSRPQ